MTTLVLNPWQDAGTVQRQFILSRAFESILYGPRGEGKTEGGIRKITLHAAEQPEECRPIPGAIIRDTWRNLERTTLKSFLQPHPGSFAEKIRPLLKVSNGGQKISLPGFWEAELFGVDSLGDLSRLQSMQLGWLWGEEPSPAAAEDIGGGLEERVITIGITSLRHPCDWRMAFCTSNYPDEDHWSWIRYAVKKIGKMFRIPRGENPHLPLDYRDNMEAALKDDEGLLNRLVLGRPGFVTQGQKVTPEYDEELHRYSEPLYPYPNLVSYRLWDGWLNPSCIVCQLTARGQLIVYEAIVGKGMGMYQFVTEMVKPIMEERYSTIPQWEDIGDPSIADVDQSNSWSSASQVIEKELDTLFRPGIRAWQPRREALRTALKKKAKGTKEELPFVLLSGGVLTQPLHRALRGGWHYRVDPSGRVVGRSPIPVKNEHSHPGDAFSYGLPEFLHLAAGGLIDAYAYAEDEGSSYSSQEESAGRCSVTGY